ncbi:cell division protein ZapA [Natronogracilivirga saccharolytica]|uniref:Cell division protein ZapA n=1 Tax=Natronogracilivirga saccharolytica TaxID=2812953 RepID=A0A8J7UWK5_9BACT|nr:cell division protein ZapA [Natronogracilivirga saccharolytica]MBP3193727.1 cell division protein ZapA [Natronogracilivirga saccharolytica]
MKSIKVSILGKQYPLKINEGDEEMMHQIAKYVDKRFQDFRKALASQSDSTIMVLASLSIAEELFLENGNQTPDTDSEKQAIFSEINHSLRELLDDIERENNDI